MPQTQAENTPTDRAAGEPTPELVLREVFGFAGFRGSQQAVIEEVMAGGDAVVLMPTGGGKSLCYQVPALLRPGLGVVVSPLIALMKDQVDALVPMPTGGGKSLCFQIPALVRPGLGIVVSPLIALMKDQVDALRPAGVRAACHKLDSLAGGSDPAG